MQEQSSTSTGPTCPSTTTCEPSHQHTHTHTHRISASISSAAASPAKTSALLAREQDSQARGPVFGTILLGSFAQFGQDGWSSKTSQLSLLEGSEPFSETWPKSGLMRNGIAYRLQPLVRRTDENESGLWRTPAAREPGIRVEMLTASATGTLGGNNRYFHRETGKLKQIGLSQQVAMRLMWPTPTARQMPCEGTVRMCREKFVAGEATLEEASAIAGRDVRDAQGKVPAMYPTPTHMGHHSGGRMNEWGGSGSRRKLNQMVQDGHLTSQDINGQLNPTWVEWLMGFPLGWTALDASATPSSRKSSKSSGGRSLQRKRG
jgi:hypothetical protein